MNIFDLQATISLNGADFMSGVEQAQGAFQGLGSSISAGTIAAGQMLGNFATKAAGELVDFGKEAVETGMTFDTTMSNVKAISGATAEEFELLRDKAMEMGATTKYTASEAGDALSYMAMAGWKTDDMLNGLEGIMNLAAASNEDLATTSDIVTDALTAFGLTAEDAGHFADVLAAASSGANTNVSMMGETFKYVAPVAGSLGYSVEDLATTIGVMANSGIKGSQAGTALRAAMSRLVKPTKDVQGALGKLGLIQLAEDTGEFEYNMEALTKETEAVKKAQDEYNTALEKYGVDSSQASKKAEKLAKAQDTLEAAMKLQKIDALQYNAAILDSDGNMLSWSDTVSILREAFSDLTEAEKAEYASALFGQEAMSGMLAIINSSEEDYNTLAESINNSSEAMGGIGAAAAMAETQLDNLGGRVTLFKSAFDGLKLAIYEGLEGPMSSAVESATEAIGVITDGFKEGGLRGAISSFGTFLKEKITGIWNELEIPEGAQKVVGFIGDLAEKARPLAGIFTDTLKNAISGVAQAAVEFMSAVTGKDTGDVSSVASAVGEFVRAFGVGVGEIIQSVASGTRSFLDAFSSVGGLDAISSVASSTREYVSAFLGAAADVISSVAGATKEFLGAFDDNGGNTAIATIAKDALELFAAFRSASADVIRDIGDGIASFIDAFPSEQVGAVVAGIAEDASKLFGAFKGVAANVISDVAEAIGIFIDGFDNDAAAGIIADLVDLIGDLFGKFTDSVAPIIEQVGAAFDGFAQKIANLWNEAGPDLEKIGNAFHTFADNVKTVVGNIMTNLQPLLEWLGSVFSVGIQLVIENLVTTVGGLANTFADMSAAVQEAFAGIIALINGDLTSATEHFKQAWEDVKTFFADLKDALIAPFKNLKEMLGDESNEAVQRLKQPFVNVATWFVDIGKQIVEGLKKGIADAWDSLTSWLGNKVSGLVDGVKGLFGISSPSRVFAEIGRYTVEGFEVGWDREFRTLERTVADDMSSLTGAASVRFDESAIGRSSAAGISSMLAASSYGVSASGEPVEINLMLDGDVAARALYDPIRRVAFQRGVGVGAETEAAYA